MTKAKNKGAIQKTEKPASIASDANKAGAAPSTTPVVEKPVVPLENKTLSEKEIDAGLSNIDKQAAGAAGKEAEKNAVMFPEGVFDGKEQTAASVASNANQAGNAAAQKSTNQEGMTWTEVVDFLGSFILALVFGSDDFSEFSMSEAEIEYWNKQERRCGIELTIDSKWFFIAGLAIAYGIKIKVAIKLKKERKAKEQEKEEKAASKA